MRITYYIIFILVCLNRAAFAQIFPIQVNTQVSPPYSPYLSDYTSLGTQKFMVQLRANDSRLTDFQVKLRITIEGVNITIRTKPSFIPQQPIIIEGGGMPQVYYGEDLAEYFNPNALDFAGDITRSQYEKGAKLSEGLYRFTVEVLDYNRNTVVSNKGTSMAWVILNDPPILNLPRKDTKIRILDPTNIVFNWTPRHTGSPNSAFTTEYVFRLVEIWPLNRNPYDAFLTQRTLYEETTSETQLVYGPSQPALLPGRKYAWQIQAKDTEGRDLFKNQGKSEVYVFQFGDALGAPENVKHEGGNASTMNISWEPPAQGEMPLEYRIRYRKKGKGDSGVWYETVTTQRWITLSSLQGNTTYDVQVRSEAKPQVSEYSALKSIRTEEDTGAAYSCGSESAMPPSENTAPLLTLIPGDVFTCRNFKVTVTDASGSNGIYTGKGIVQVPFFNMANVNVMFAGIQLNNKYQVVYGEVISTYNPGSEMAKVIEEAHKIGEEKPEESKPSSDSTIVTPAIIYNIPGTIDSVWVDDNGEIVVADIEGNRTTYTQPAASADNKSQPVQITDGAGNTYVVEKDEDTGKTKVTKIESGGMSASRNSAHVATPRMKVEVFKKIISRQLAEIKQEATQKIGN